MNRFVLFLIVFFVLWIGISMDTPGDGRANVVTIFGGLLMLCPWLIFGARLLWGSVVILILIGVSVLIYLTQ